MPRRKTVDDGHELNRNSAALDGAVDLLGAARRKRSSTDPAYSLEESAGDALVVILNRTDGWLRLIPWGDNKIGYFKFKFSSGRHTGKYVMYVCNAGAWAEGILGLAEKLLEVDSDMRRPAQDTFYDPR